MKETLLKAGATKPTKGSAKVTSNWALQKCKDNIDAYKKHSKRRAVERLMERRRQEAIIAARKQQVTKDAEQHAAAAKEKRRQEADERRRQKAEKAAIQAKTRSRRHKQLMENLSDDFNEVVHDLGYTFKFIPSSKFSGLLFNAYAKLGPHGSNLLNNEKEVIQAFERGIPFSARRTVADISEKEIGLLKLLSFMNTMDLFTDQYYDFMQLCIVYNKGGSIISKESTAYVTSYSDDAIPRFIKLWLEEQTLTPQLAVNEAIVAIGKARKEIDDPEIRQIIEKELVGSAGWLRAESL